ncbi:hypothetical protein TNCV_2690681 [Trichonephila clavipes]|uniref:Uncharacterized protein n=1 Tax=Trichonephila clavipes TaxID=2585209 RepID=A0A8X6VYF5_TRICX|nr:hypothetical protein TNCV_2690681 [Trichonephila clavipes]
MAREASLHPISGIQMWNDCWNTLDKTLRSFWETENLSEEQPIISDELSYCEKLFEKTHFRKPCGRYSVSPPLKENIQENENLESIILHGFSDASEKGFGAITYVSVIKNKSDRQRQLLCSKSRVAPLKTLTISRLELIRKVINALKMNLSQVILLLDSTRGDQMKRYETK